ncbi:hypothetical protein WR25_01444 [Diploscapter pachys]|uniref:Uncharacterized protein n=1 Tax=Diploscapter pachys TaxID=2018661 RepID=A0A2A2KIS9_9BILA|nr:hypothetical protein WR25_01444 [Diploscapter pachys]
MVKDDEVTKLMKQYGDIFEQIENEKVRCTLTGHEVKKRTAALQEYINSKKFQTAWKVHQITEKTDVFVDIGVKGKVGCKITKKMIALNPAAMERHLNGKKLKGALARGVTGDEAEEETDEDEEEEGSGAERDMSADEGMHEEGNEDVEMKDADAEEPNSSTERKRKANGIQCCEEGKEEENAVNLLQIHAN